MPRISIGKHKSKDVNEESEEGETIQEDSTSLVESSSVQVSEQFESVKRKLRILVLNSILQRGSPGSRVLQETHQDPQQCTRNPQYGKSRVAHKLRSGKACQHRVLKLNNARSNPWNAYNP